MVVLSIYVHNYVTLHTIELDKQSNITPNKSEISSKSLIDRFILFSGFCHTKRIKLFSRLI